jgi:enamine deaminase RidA (YjgF/YER057c/UK114 family)
MIKIHNPATVHPPAGSYSHAMEVPPGARLLFVSGQVGADRNGESPAEFAAQCELAWANLAHVLAAAGMTREDLVKLTVYLVRESDLPSFRQVRDRFLQGRHPATTLVFVKALARPGWLVEIEAIAAAPGDAP